MRSSATPASCSLRSSRIAHRLGQDGEDLAEQAPQLGALTHQESGRELRDAALPGLGEVDAGELGPLIGAHRAPAWRARMIRLAITAHVSGS
jgi:hypothetical protein